jgi:hypothetical protein
MKSGFYITAFLSLCHLFPAAGVAGGLSADTVVAGRVETLRVGPGGQGVDSVRMRDGLSATGSLAVAGTC